MSCADPATCTCRKCFEGRFLGGGLRLLPGPASERRCTSCDRSLAGLTYWLEGSTMTCQHCVGKARKAKRRRAKASR